ncbi:hypothetical protein Tco_0246977 [Tanacetum coccineum]
MDVYVEGGSTSIGCSGIESLVGCGYGGGGGKFHGDSSYKNDSVNDSRLIEVKRFFTKPYEALEVLDMVNLLEVKGVAEDGDDNESN